MPKRNSRVPGPKSRPAPAALPVLIIDERNAAPSVCAGLGSDYLLGPEVERLPPARYARQLGDPLHRSLRVYTGDPATSRLESSVASVNVAYEPLQPGPVGAILRVDDYDATHDVRYRRVDLDEKKLLMEDGLPPSPSEPRFHQQMVYVVCMQIYDVFRCTLGRDLPWGHERAEEPERLLIQPHAFLGRNAYYDKQLGALCFGYYRAEAQTTDRTLPGGFVFTCLSQDIIAHEMTHALLDGLRPRYTLPMSIDTLAFHEAFADLVALFDRYRYSEVVRGALSRARGVLENAPALTELARQFGHSTGVAAALRSAIDTQCAGDTPPPYDQSLEHHCLGSVLVGAIFEAFLTVYKRKTARYMRLATHGSGVLPPGDLPGDLCDLLAEQATRLAGQFLSICIRALDYCPPTDLRFGEYIRALITADYDLVPEDKWAYREALIDAFRRRRIYPPQVSSLSEDALLWRPPNRPLPLITELNFAHLRFRGDPGRTASPEELRRQACVLGRYASDPRYAGAFGVVAADDPRLAGDSVDLPCVESIRTSRRSGPGGSIAFDLVAEITQRRHVRPSKDQPGFDYYGGATVILGPTGEIRYVIGKSVAGAGRLERRREFLASATGQAFWQLQKGHFIPRASLFRLLCVGTGQ